MNIYSWSYEHIYLRL